jgi:hypothetical protein
MKHNPTGRLIIATGIFLLICTISCRKNFNEKITYENNASTTSSRESNETILGVPIRNPYKVETVNMAIALLKKMKTQGLLKDGNGITPANMSVINPDDTISVGLGGGPLPPNYLYIRFLPANIEQLTKLEDDLGLDLWDVPLDREIEQEGEWYQDPSLPADAITWQYTMVPVGYPIPEEIKHEIISTVFLFNEDAGEPNEPEDDWGGDPVGPVDPIGIRNTDGSMHIRQYFAAYGNPMKKANEQLEQLAPGITREELYNTLMTLTGNTEELGEADAATGRRRRYYPSGYLKVRNTDYPVMAAIDALSDSDPLKGAYVKSRNFFKLGHTYTDANGYFKIEKGYKRKAQVIVKFKNNRCAVKGITGALKLWQYAFPVKKKLGRYYRADLENLRYQFDYSNDASSHKASTWAAGNMLNTRWETDEQNVTNGLPHLPYLKIWMYSKYSNGRTNETPMYNNMYTIGSGSFGCQLSTSLTTLLVSGLITLPAGPVVGGVAAGIQILLNEFKPDLVLCYGEENGNSMLSSRIINAAYKHLALATLYQQVGNSYWCDYNGAYEFGGGTYISGYDDDKEWVRLVEGWGQYIGSTYTVERYRISNVSTAFLVERRQKADIENFRADSTVENGLVLDTTGYRGWINCGFLYDLTDNGENTAITRVTDFASEYSTFRLFSAYKKTIKKMADYRSVLLQNSINLQAAEVNQLYNSYGY